MAEQQKRNQIIFSIQQYLAEIQQNPPSGSNIDADSLEVVVQCLKAAFSVDVSEPEHQKLYSIPKTLPQIFEDGYFNSQVNIKSEAKDDVFENNFQQYLRVLTEKGYFNNVNIGSDEYNLRVQKAREKLEESEKAKQVENEKKAEEKKLEGNSLVASKQFEQAIQAYTEAIAYCPNNPIYYANRAAAYSHLKQHNNAIEDCKLAIAVDPKYTKAYSRMGLAHFSLGEYEEAFSAYKKAYELDPSDAIKQSLNIAEKKIKEKSDQAPKAPSASSGAGAGAGGANPFGGIDFSSLLNNPAVQNILSGLGGAGGAGGAGGLGSRAGAGSDPSEGFSTGVDPNSSGENAPPPAMPNISEMLNNPQIRSVAENVMNNPNLSSLLNNPAIMNMASSLMQNPEMINSVLQNFGGGGGFPGFPPNNNNN